MRNNMKYICAVLACVFCFVLAGCDMLTKTDDTNDSEPNISNNPNTTPSISDNQPTEPEIAQRWRYDDFTAYYEDSEVFVPAADDYLLTETYDNMLDLPEDYQYISTTGQIPYRLTVLYSFDENGNIVSQIERYSFLESCEESGLETIDYAAIGFGAQENILDIFGRACFSVFAVDGTAYPSLIQINNVVYVEMPPEKYSQNSKAEFTNDFAPEEEKHWFSMPLADNS